MGADPQRQAVQRYAVALHEKQEAERRAEVADQRMRREGAATLAHLRDHGPVTCALVNTDRIVTLLLRRNGEAERIEAVVTDNPCPR